MKIKLLMLVILINTSIYAQKYHSVFFSNGNTKISNDNSTQIVNYLNQFDPKNLKSITLNVYNDDTGNDKINAILSQKRVTGLKLIFKKNKITTPIIVNYQGVVDITNNHKYSSTELEDIRNKNRRIDVHVATTNYVITDNKKNIKNEGALFTEKENKHAVFYGSASNTVLNFPDRQEIITSIKKIDTEKVKSISLNVYNDDSGNYENDNLISKKRAEELKNIINTNSPNIDVYINYRGNFKTEIKKAYLDQHVEYLKNKNRRIELVANYGDPVTDISSLNLVHTFSQESRAGDRIHLKHGVFTDNKSILTKEMANELDRVVMQLNKYSKLHVEIQGHICCTNGGHEAIDKDTGKLELSINRAKVVYSYLIKKGVDAKRLRFKGYGNQKPLGFDEELNKRIELYILRS